MSCTLHDVHDPQSASASITASQLRRDLWRRSSGAGLVNVGFVKRATRCAARRELSLEAVEEDVAARLGDVEQTDACPSSAREPRGARVPDAVALARGVEERLRAHGPTLS